MRFRTTFAQTGEVSAAANSRAAVRIIKADLADFSPAMIIYFAATDYEPHLLAAEMHDAFPGVTTLGCTTAGEGVDDRVLNASVVAMAFSAEVFDYRETALVLADGREADRADAFASTEEAMRYLGRRLDHDLVNLDYKRYIGFMLADQISSFSESVLEKVGEMTDAIFVGGFAGDDCKFIDGQMIFYEGRAYRNAVVLALWKPRDGFALLKTQAVEKTGARFLVTKADEEAHIIWEFDGQPAASVYARLIGVPVETMGSLDFDGNPIAVTADGEPFICAIVKTVDGRGLQMFARIREGTSYTLTRAGDILGVTKRALEEKKRELGHISAVLHVNCFCRHTTLKNQGQVDAFGKLFAGMSGVAFSSYGEIHVGSIAMTSTMILFK